MTTRRAPFLRLALVLTALGACSEDAAMSFPEEDASDQDAPTFDVPTTDTGLDAGTDRGAATDTPARDRAATETTICPASCGASADCDPCRTADTPSTVQYCCLSGLCVSMTGTCPASTDGGPGDAMPTDGPGDGGGDGGDGAGTDDMPDPTDDAPADDTGMLPPDDVGPASDLGGDAATGDAATGDAATGDAVATMDAADGHD